MFGAPSFHIMKPLHRSMRAAQFFRGDLIHVWQVYPGLIFPALGHTCPQLIRRCCFSDTCKHFLWIEALLAKVQCQPCLVVRRWGYRLLNPLKPSVSWVICNSEFSVTHALYATGSSPAGPVGFNVLIESVFVWFRSHILASWGQTHPLPKLTAPSRCSCPVLFKPTWVFRNFTVSPAVTLGIPLLLFQGALPAWPLSYSCVLLW